MMLITNSFYNEITGREPVATLTIFLDNIAIKGDAIGQLAISDTIRHSDVVEIDAIPTVALSTMGRGLVDI